jgi:hypothetical protein
MMDAKLWPKLEKTINGTIRGKKFSESYTPETDIGERVDVKVDYGFGVGGYQGFLMHLQAGEAKTMSRRRVMEAMPGIHDVDEELSLIEIESMDEAGMAMFQQQAAMGQMDMRIWSIVRKDMAEKGLPLFEAIIKYEELLAEQAMEAQGTDQGALMAPHPEEEMMEEAPLPGIPPGAMI